MQQNSQYQEAASKTLQTINVLHVNLMMNITDYWEIIHGVRISHITSLKAERNKNIPYVVKSAVEPECFTGTALNIF